MQGNGPEALKMFIESPLHLMNNNQQPEGKGGYLKSNVSGFINRLLYCHHIERAGKYTEHNTSTAPFDLLIRKMIIK